jgi:hypothetical protein
LVSRSSHVAKNKTRTHTHTRTRPRSHARLPYRLGAATLVYSWTTSLRHKRARQSPSPSLGASGTSAVWTRIEPRRWWVAPRWFTWRRRDEARRGETRRDNTRYYTILHYMPSKASWSVYSGASQNSETARQQDSKIARQHDRNLSRGDVGRACQPVAQRARAVADADADTDADTEGVSPPRSSIEGHEQHEAQLEGSWRTEAEEAPVCRTEASLAQLGHASLEATSLGGRQHLPRRSERAAGRKVFRNS